MRRIALSSVLVAMFVAPDSGYARQIGTSEGFTAIYVFGDSLSDTGNVSILTDGGYPPRIGNGKLYVDFLAEHYETGPMTPSLLGGTNYAAIGGGVGPGWDFDVPGTSAIEQYGVYLEDAQGRGDKKAFYIVQIGTNQIFNQILQGWDPLDSVENTAADLETLLGMLAATPDVDHVWVVTAPYIRGIPIAAFFEQFFPGFTESINTAIPAYNERIFDIVSRSTIKDIRVADWYALEADIVANPAAYGFTDVTTPCSGFLVGGVTCSNPNEHFYWDHSHRTERVHLFVSRLFLHERASD